MVEKLSLHLFVLFMLSTAGMVLSLIWMEGFFEERLAPTFFILGLASGIIWGLSMVYKTFNALFQDI